MRTSGLARRLGALALPFALSTPAALAGGAGPTGVMYLTAAGPDTVTFHRIRGDRALGSWTGLGSGELVFAVDDTVRSATTGGGTSAEYRLDGLDTGRRFGPADPALLMWDGTGDGTHNYAVSRQGPGWVWRYEEDWSGGAALFSTGWGACGVAHDPRDGSFWVAAEAPDRVVHVSATGEPLGSFALGIGRPTGIGLDHADGTLWVAAYTTGVIHQYSVTGEHLQAFAPPGVESAGIRGVEFRIPPACPADLDRSGVLSLADFTAFRDAYVSGDLIADLDGDDRLTLADFAFFRNAYVVGCP